jgi:hypothetical protein
MNTKAQADFRRVSLSAVRQDPGPGTRIREAGELRGLNDSDSVCAKTMMIFGGTF